MDCWGGAEVEVGVLESRRIAGEKLGGNKCPLGDNAAATRLQIFGIRRAVRSTPDHRICPP